MRFAYGCVSWSASTISVGLIWLLCAACTGDQFGQDAPAGGAGGAGGAAGMKQAASGQSGAQTGGNGGQLAAGSSQGGGSGGAQAGSAGTSGAGSSGTSAFGGAAGLGAAAGAAGATGGAGQGAGSSGAAGGTSVALPSIAEISVYAENCDGARYEGPGGAPEVPQGAGPRCMILAGEVEAGDTIVVGDVSLVTTFDPKAKTVRTMWDVPHGAGKESTNVEVRVARGQVKSAPRTIVLTARHVSANGSDSALGNAASPWATLSRALLDASGDWISLVDVPTKADSPKGGFSVGPGVTIASKTVEAVSLMPTAAFELQSGASLRRLTIDCAALPGLEACVVARGKGVVLEKTSIAHSKGPGLHLKFEDASAEITGGSFVEARILVDARGNALKLRGSTFVLPAGVEAGISVKDPLPGSQSIEVGSDDTTTTFSSEGSPWLRVDGSQSVSLRNLTGTGGGSSAAFAEVGAIDLRNVSGAATLRDVAIASAATGVIAGAGTLLLDGVQVANASVGAILSGQTTNAVIQKLDVVEAKTMGVKLEAGQVSVPGSLSVKWATRGPFVSQNPLLGVDVTAGKVTVTGSATVEHCAGTSIRLNGGELVSKPTVTDLGVRVHDTQGPALRVLRGRADLTGGGFTGSDAPGDAPALIDVLSPVSCQATLRGTTFAYDGSTAVPTPSPLVLPPNVSPKKHSANTSGEPSTIYVLLDQPNPRGLLRLQVLNGPNASVDSYVELLPLP